MVIVNGFATAELLLVTLWSNQQCQSTEKLKAEPPTTEINLILSSSTATSEETGSSPFLLFLQCHYYYYTRLTAFCPGLPRWASTREVKPIWILLKQETVSGSGISWAICKSAPRSRQITMPAPHHSVFYRPDALPTTQPTASKHWALKAEPLLWVYIHKTLAAFSGTFSLIVCKIYNQIDKPSKWPNNLCFAEDNICVWRGTFVDVRSADDKENVLWLADSHSWYAGDLL